MATVFDSIDIRGLRKAHLRQLLDYADHREQEGWYYGNREQYEKRHADLVRWLEDACAHAYSGGVIIPKA